jgi:hypothetical protein
MVGNRPVIGVRNPVGSTSTPSYLRAKNAGMGLPDSGDNQLPGKNPRVSPVKLLEAAPKSHPE